MLDNGTVLPMRLRFLLWPLKLSLASGFLEHKAHDTGDQAKYKAYYEVQVKEAGAQNGSANEYYAHDEKYLF